MRITAVLAADAAGGKLPAMIVFNGKGPHRGGSSPLPTASSERSRTLKQEGLLIPARSGVRSGRQSLVLAAVVQRSLALAGVDSPPGARHYRQPDSLLAWDV